MLRLVKKSIGVGVVRAVDRKRIIVMPMPADDDDARGVSAGAAVGCGKCGGCVSSITEGRQGCSASTTKGGHPFGVNVNNSGIYKSGDRVQYIRYIPEPNLASALIFGVPVSFAVTAPFVVDTLSPLNVAEVVNAVSRGETLAITAAAAAFCIGIAVVGIFDKLFKIKYPPSIIKECGGAP